MKKMNKKICEKKNFEKNQSYAKKCSQLKNNFNAQSFENGVFQKVKSLRKLKKNRMQIVKMEFEKKIDERKKKLIEKKKNNAQKFCK